MRHTRNQVVEGLKRMRKAEYAAITELEVLLNQCPVVAMGGVQKDINVRRRNAGVLTAAIKLLQAKTRTAPISDKEIK